MTERIAFDWLRARTGWDAPSWVGAVQRAIKRASGPVRRSGKYKGHSSTDVRAWLEEVSGLVIRKARILRHKGRDENMGLAATLGIILVAWYVRVQRAKAMDPRRPIENRRVAMVNVTSYVVAVTRAIYDESFDPALFPDQEWENPWHPKDRDGKFV